MSYAIQEEGQNYIPYRILPEVLVNDKIGYDMLAVKDREITLVYRCNLF